MENQKSNSVNPVAAALTGAVIGAGVVVTGVVALNNKNNRKKVEDAVEIVKDKLGEIKKIGESTIDDLDKSVKNTKKTIKKSKVI